MAETLPLIVERYRLPSPATTPQSLAWRGGASTGPAPDLWLGSRDLRRIYQIDRKSSTVTEEAAAPGIPWASAAAKDGLLFTLGEGPDDDRYLRRYFPGKGFSDERIAC